jgi:EAL domain-containing protein (putative c-di-GMP-specific phosphodiesterase class I)
MTQQKRPPEQSRADSFACQGCRDGGGFGIPISMAFQPIADVISCSVFAHEALVRGVDGQGAPEVLSLVSEDNRYGFDQLCRTTAIDLAGRLGLGQTGASLAINFLPNAVYNPAACIKTTLAAAERTRFPLDRIIFEFSEVERLDTGRLLTILRAYRDIGFRTALDDFGAEFAGVGVLAKFQPDVVKLDIDLIRGIDQDRAKRTIVGHCLKMVKDIGAQAVCEGVETPGEFAVLRDMGATLMQGFLLARPAFEGLAEPVWPSATAA